MPQQSDSAVQDVRGPQRAPIRHDAVTGSERVSGPDFPEMMARCLGGRVMQALADDDVTELDVNPQDGAEAPRPASRSRGGAPCKR